MHGPESRFTTVDIVCIVVIVALMGLMLFSRLIPT